MSDTEEENKTGNYWPSIADLFLTLFVIAIAIIAVVFYSLLPTNNVGKDRALVNAVGNDLRHVRTPVNRLRHALGLAQLRTNARPSEVISALSETCDIATSRIERLNAQIVDLQTQLHDKPPNIQISEQKKDYRFKSGSSVMGAAFVNGLRQNEFDRLAREIVEREAEGRVKVDTLEIIGHTDGVPLTTNGNLDVKLPDVLTGNGLKISSLTAGSNNDLGLLRALAVKEQWMRFVNTHQEKEILQRVSVRCYSAGQTILPESNSSPTADEYRKPNGNARRIEMRLTRLMN
jgi:hypothetical protein